MSPVGSIGKRRNYIPPHEDNVYVVGASQYGGPSDPSSGHTGSCGNHLDGTHAFAELYMGSALGGLPCGTQLEMQVVGGHGATVTATKMDIGLGGSPVQGHARRVDLWYQTAQAMGFSGTGLIRIKRLDGRKIIGPNDKETKEGAESLIEPFGGPHSEGAAEAGAKAVASVASWTKDLGKILAFIGSSSGWMRIGKVVVGTGLMLIAIDQLSKIGPGPEINATGAVKKIARV